MATYSGNPTIGVNKIIRNAAKNWNQNDELRALASFITHINAAIRIKKITIALQSRILF